MLFVAFCDAERDRLHFSVESTRGELRQQTFEIRVSIAGNTPNLRIPTYDTDISVHTCVQSKSTCAKSRVSFDVLV